MNIPINRVIVTTVLSSLLMVPRALTCAAGITELARFYIDARMRTSESSGYQVVQPRREKMTATSSWGQGHTLGSQEIPSEPVRGELFSMPKLPSCKEIYEKMELFGPNGLCKTGEHSHYYNLSSALIASGIAVAVLATVNFLIYGSFALTIGSALYTMALSTALTAGGAGLHIAFAQANA